MTIQFIVYYTDRKEKWDNEYLLFDTLGEPVQLQAVSCHICGEYIASSALTYGNVRQLCNCPHNHAQMLDLYGDNDEEYEYII